MIVLGGIIGWTLLRERSLAGSSYTPVVSTLSPADILHDYPGLPEDHLFTGATSDEIIGIFQSGSGVVFLGFPECPWCQKFAPILNEAAKGEVDRIYYLNIKKLLETNPTKYQELMTFITPYLGKNEDGEPVLTTPDVSVVKDGEIIGRHELEPSADNEKTPGTYWTSERKQRAITNMRGYMHEIATAAGD